MQTVRSRFVLKMVVIASAGAAVGLILNAVSGAPVALNQPVYPAAASGGAACTVPGQPAPPPSISLEEAISHCEACSAAFVDARGAAAFASGHIPGAVHLPPQGHPDETQTLAGLRAHSLVIVYGEGGGCNLATNVVDRLRQEGLTNVHLLSASFDAWMEKEAPAQSGACHACEIHSADGGEAPPGGHR